MKFTVQGTSYEFPELQDCTTKELRSVKEHSGMGLRKLMEGFYDMDPDAVTAVVYIAKLRAGEKVSWEDLDEIRPLQDIDWPDWGSEESDEGKSQDPPTSGSTGSGTSRTRGSRSTSGSSRTTSTSTPESSTS